MKILYCIPHLHNAGGMERVLTQKINWLSAHTTHEITVLTTERTPAGDSTLYFPLNQQIHIEELNINFNDDYTKPLLSKWWWHMRRMRAYERALRALIATHHIDLCISLGGKEIAFLHSMPCRTIAELHFAKDHRKQLLETTHHGRLWSLLGAIRTWQLVHEVKRLEQLVVLTERDKFDWQAAGCNNVICIPNPCSLDGKELPVTKKKTQTVLAAGRLHEQKGFDLLLQAWEPVEKKYPDWTLRIVGKGDQRAQLERQITVLGLKHVCLTGQKDDMAEEYTNAAFFILPSRYEGLPLVLIEAMWCGIPSIAFDCPHGPGELLADNRGWLVPNGNIAALTKQIEYAIGHPDEAAHKAAQAKAYAHKNYSEAAIMPQWLDVIEQH